MRCVHNRHEAAVALFAHNLLSTKSSPPRLDLFHVKQMMPGASFGLKLDMREQRDGNSYGS
jgi:hypothetical protein